LLQPDIYQAFIAPLNQLGIPYFVTGSTAGIVYGEPRMTNDIDIVVKLAGTDVQRFVDAFPDAHYYCPPADVLLLEVRRGQRGHCNLIDHATGFKADIYIAFDELHAWAMTNRRDLALADFPMFVAPPEYVILRKLEYFREGGSQKHLRDIRGILEVSQGQLDLPFIEQWTSKLGLISQWNTAQNGSAGQ
jgi:hypothetical protein